MTVSTALQGRVAATSAAEPDRAGPADDAARRRCLDTAASFIVQAPAGAGKTELLIQRMLALLAQVDEPESVVAITFTRKAAAEMRHRVLEALQRAADATPPALPHARRTWELARAVLEQERDCDWALRRYPSRLTISTIDSLCLHITRQVPLLARLGPAPALAVAPEVDALYLAAARQTVQRMQGDDVLTPALSTLLLHLDNNVPRAAGLLVQMLARRDQWQRHLRVDEPLQLRRTLELALQRLACDQMRDVAALWPPGEGEEMLALARFAAAHLPVDTAPDEPLRRLSGLRALPAPEAPALPLWQGLATLLLTQAGTWRKTVNKHQGFPPAGAAPPAEREQLKAQHGRMRDLLTRLDGHQELAAALHRLRYLPLAYPEPQWAALQALIDVLPGAVEALRRVFAAQNAVDHTEVALAATQAMAPGVAGRAAPLLLHQMRHLLIDEFQDTSVSQHRLLLRLIAGWIPGDGRTVFLVGDPMQSIYRFREAEVGVFLRVCSDGLGTLRPEPLHLSTNFRSAQALVDWVNGRFPAVLAPRPDAAKGAVPYTPFAAHPGAPAGVPVMLHAQEELDLDAEARAVVGIVREAHRQRPGGSVAILVRMRRHLERIVPALRAAGVRFRAMDIDPLSERPLVRDLLALTRALLHRADRIAWLSVLRAPWCGLTLADLWTLAGAHPQRTLWACMRDEQLVAALSPDGQARLRRVVEALAPALEHRERASLRRQVERAWLNLGGALGIAEGDVTDARAYLDMLGQVERAGSLDDLGDVERALQALYAAPDPLADETLHVMTIFHAKGLEFDTVIVPGLGRPPRSDPEELLMWMERPGDPGAAEELVLAPIAETGAGRDALFDHLRALHREKSRHELGRLIYVAATRARSALHLLGHARRNASGELAPDARSLLATLWPALAGEFGARLATPDITPGATAADAPTAPTAPARGLHRLSPHWTVPTPPPALRVAAAAELPVSPPPAPLEYSWAGDMARYVGTVVHRTLQQIAQGDPVIWTVPAIEARRPSFGAALRQLGLPQDGLDQAVSRVVQALTSTLRDARGRWLLAPHAEAHSEMPLTAVLEGRVTHVVLDRTFVADDGTRWIVDFKTGSHEGTELEAFLDREQERYRQQLETYGRVVALWDPGRPVRLGLYFPLLQAWREWPAP